MAMFQPLPPNSLVLDIICCCILNRMRISIRGLTGCAGHAHAFCLLPPRPLLALHFKSKGAVHVFQVWVTPHTLICIVFAVNEFHILYLCESS
ncbi:LOW QUALITY PROTEIN: uncharacterized protein Dana_GF27090 [Drosophila ananassae]|uniref:Uncharacterized protein n=1 Tax=Drosophila ananassae TaxID=7217 RepID=A0A0N8P1S0_DROAN|nr:LOW QUALITY PROTEIN: uncharacterized protein Dana_GF27090 [Drosophila ananassae]